MTGNEAREIISDIKGRGGYVSIEGDSVVLDGVFTIKELHAVIQLMEHSD